mgnify:CR=1 FL=1
MPVKQVRRFFDKHRKVFLKKGKLENFYFLFEVFEVFFFMDKRTRTAPHIRDGIDSKRLMITVVAALVPAAVMACYNTGLQANLLLSGSGPINPSNWQQSALLAMGIPFSPENIFANFVHGAFYFLPVYITAFAAGIFWEVIFSTVRKHPVNEGFFVTSFLFALILPPAIPLWQVVLGISFGVVLGKEVFGGVGMNIFNPALTGRVFLFFAYPAWMSGDRVWAAVDAVSRATPLAAYAENGIIESVSWLDAFLGMIPGSMGETSALACLIGAAVLILSGIGSWRIMISVLAGMIGTVLFFNLTGSHSNPMFAMGPHWHLVLGGFAFGTVFMATDPVSCAMTLGGKYVYGFLIGFLTAMVRVLNPAFPEGMMLAILFSNAFAPLIDRFFIQANIKRRMAGYAR